MIAQTFANSSNLLPGSFHSGNCTGVVDMDNDGLDDIVILDESTNLKVAYQQANGTFTVSDFGTVSGDQQWGMAVGDIDNDGHKDVMCGGSYDNVHIININGPSDFVQIEMTWASIFMQACNFADINNDGWLDGFACHDDGHSAILQNIGGGSLINGSALIDQTFYPEINGNDNSGNYGSHWCDFDRDGDIDCMIAKCRQFINNPLDPRRTNILLVNDGNNNYVDEAQTRGLVNLQQSWTSDFADLDNDGDFDCLITTHSGTLEIYENNGFGYFTNATIGSGLELGGFYLQAKTADFDNDGFVDIIHSGGSHRYFKNNGDLTFTEMNNVFPAIDEMHTFGIGDLDHDGWLDLYAGYGDGYNDPDFENTDKLFINNGGANNFIVFDLEGTMSNKGAAGALIEIHGPWGVQIREVRDGESYGITNTSMCHFGLGTATAVDYAIIHWPAGGIQVIDNPTVNVWHQITEGVCEAPTSTISAAGSTSICPGQSVGLNILTSGANYVWSNGSSNATLLATSTGNYHIISWDASGCGSMSNTISIDVAADEVPTVVSNGELKFCEGNSIELVSSVGQAYLWSNNQDSQSITITEAGTYSVQVTGSCETLSSQEIIVEVLSAPSTPIIDDVTIQESTSAQLTVSDENANWYDSADAVEPVFTGATYTTPPLTETTSFWVEEYTVHGGQEAQGAKVNNSTGQYQTSNSFYLKFDVFEDVVIKTVKVYSSSSSDRTIEVIDAQQQVVTSGTYLIPNGESVVTLDLSVPVGTGYGIRVTNNNPALWRDRNLDLLTPYDYPYNIGDLLTITGTNVSGDNVDNYYYFFYDWTVQSEQRICVGPREEVQVMIVGIEELEGTSRWSLYPNPTEDQLNISFNNLIPGMMSVDIIDQVGRNVKSTSWNCSTGNQQFQLDLAGLPAAIYHLRIIKDDSVASYPLIKK